MVRMLIKSYTIYKPKDLHNVGGKGLQFGKSVAVKVICVSGRRSSPLQTNGDQGVVTAIEVIVPDKDKAPQIQ